MLGGTRTHAVIGGRAERALLALPEASVDLVLVDCPYSSGGAFRGDRAKSTDTKYTHSGYRGRHADFEGDTRDPMGFFHWAGAIWLPECYRVLRAGGSIVATIDWRMLTTLELALQAAGFTVRGIGTWDKGMASRPRPGGFRMQAEYLVHATRGAQVDRSVYLPGVFPYPTSKRDKFHQTGKPTQLFYDLAALAPDGGLVLDPFAGSGTSGAGALLRGRGLRFLGVELVDGYRELANARLDALAALVARDPGNVGNHPFFWREVEHVQNAVFDAWKRGHADLAAAVEADEPEETVDAREPLLTQARRKAA